MRSELVTRNVMPSHIAIFTTYCLRVGERKAESSFPTLLSPEREGYVPRIKTAAAALEQAMYMRV